MGTISMEAQTQIRATHNHCAQSCRRTEHNVQSYPVKHPRSLVLENSTLAQARNSLTSFCNGESIHWLSGLGFINLCTYESVVPQNDG